ncbi:MAG TPA: helix-turn-helix transcriptional regulator [Sedimentibacter sp.]|nr:helix-turn-helix transcriptional regulator [Sedimentibacter sp.]
MSRQYDESIEGKFDYNGEWYSLIEDINSLEDLIEAMRIRELLVQCENQFEPDSGHPCFWMLRQQDEYIEEYLEKFGDFDKTIMNTNIAFLLKKYDMRMGELEQLLKISSGYISRTVKPSSDKKLSIDVVWKIAKIFDISLSDLLGTDLSIPKSNTDMVAKFLIKLCEQTKENIIEWESEGGVMTVLNDKYKEMGLVTEENEDKVVYHPQHLNPDYKWILTDDIFVCKNIDAKKGLAIISYSDADKEKLQGYDFIFVWSDKDGHHWEKAFYTVDDPFGTLKKHAAQLYKHVQVTELDAKVAPAVRGLIADYLKGGS